MVWQPQPAPWQKHSSIHKNTSEAILALDAGSRRITSMEPHVAGDAPLKPTCVRVRQEIQPNARMSHPPVHRNRCPGDGEAVHHVPAQKRGACCTATGSLARDVPQSKQLCVALRQGWEALTRRAAIPLVGTCEAARWSGRTPGSACVQRVETGTNQSFSRPFPCCSQCSGSLHTARKRDRYMVGRGKNILALRPWLKGPQMGCQQAVEAAS